MSNDDRPAGVFCRHDHHTFVILRCFLDEIEYVVPERPSFDIRRHLQLIPLEVQVRDLADEVGVLRSFLLEKRLDVFGLAFFFVEDVDDFLVGGVEDSGDVVRF